MTDRAPFDDPSSGASGRIVALGRVALAIARADDAGLDRALAACRDIEAARRDLVEAVLQGIPYSGFPGAIDALGRWNDFEVVEGASETDEVSLRTKGRKNFTAVYGELGARVLAELRRRHPDLESWILEFAYGRVMGRGQLPLSDLEALGVASLLGQRRRAPLHSHLRGAHRVGWSKSALSEFLDRLAPECDASIVEYARGVVTKL